VSANDDRDRYRRTLDMDGCPFCAIAADPARQIPGVAGTVDVWPETMAIVPRGGGTVPGHTLVIPRAHVPGATVEPLITATTVARACELAARMYQFPGVNIIVNAGEDATQTVFHLHVHIIPRRPGDGLALPWTHGEGRRTDHAADNSTT